MTTLGLIAGNGRFPFLVADEARRAGDRVVAVALRDEADPALAEHVDAIHWVALGQFQGIIDALKAESITTALMAGQVKHARLFTVLSMDMRTVRLLARIKDKKTDTILGAVAEELAGEGITLVPSHRYLKPLLPEPGLLAGPALDKRESGDVEFGRGLAKQIAGLDIGQTVIVKDRAVLAVESIEGTNQCIRRAAQYGGSGVVVVKVAKPGQDWRFDIPVVGPETIAVMDETGARVLAVEARATLLVDRQAMLKNAAERRISVIAL